MTESPMYIICSNCTAKNRLPQAKLDNNPLCGKCGNPVLSTRPIAATDKNFNLFITSNDLPVVVDFWADWCGPCRQFAPIFAQLAADMDKLACFVKLDTAQHPHTASTYHIRSIPTLMIFHHGKELARLSGALPQTQFKQWLAQNLPGI